MSRFAADGGRLCRSSALYAADVCISLSFRFLSCVISSNAYEYFLEFVGFGKSKDQPYYDAYQ